MKNAGIRLIAAVVAIVFIVGAWIKSGQLDLDWLRYLSIAVLLATGILTAWDLWLWRLGLAQAIPGVPKCLRGTWQGVLTSYWINPETGERARPKTAYLVVRQSSSHVSVALLTNESRSKSSLATVSKIDGTSELTYIYLNRPDLRVNLQSQMHHGSTVLIMSGKEQHRRLKGRYWTDRDTKGELDFTSWSKQIVDDFDEAKGLFSTNGNR
jgi:hypothetical protein